MMKQLLYKYYLKAKHRKFIKLHSKAGTQISKKAKGILNAIFEGQNAVPEGCSFSGNIKLGYRTTLGTSNILSGNVQIGKYCQLGMNVAIISTNHPISNLSTYINTRLFTNLSELKIQKEILIGNDVWIGHGVVILGGVTVGNGAIIAAGSIVTKSIEPYTIVAGNPAKAIRMRYCQNIIQEIEGLQWWDKSDDELAKLKPLFFKDFSNASSIYE